MQCWTLVIVKVPIIVEKNESDIGHFRTKIRNKLLAKAINIWLQNKGETWLTKKVILLRVSLAFIILHYKSDSSSLPLSLSFSSSPSHSVSPRLSFFLSLPLSFFPSLPIFLSFSPSLPYFLSFFPYLSFLLSLSFFPSLPILLSFSPYLSFLLSLSFFPSLPIFLSFSPYLSFFPPPLSLVFPLSLLQNRSAFKARMFLFLSLTTGFRNRPFKVTCATLKKYQKQLNLVSLSLLYLS
jgi:hypothetical protein